MKITRVCVYLVELPSTGITPSEEDRFRKKDAYHSVIVEVETDAGITGLGEVCTIGTGYMRGFAEGAAAGVPILAKAVIGEDPFHTVRLNRAWDRAFKDDLYVKAPLDMALWDIMGQASGRPVCDLLGGRYEGQAPLYRSIYQPHDIRVGQDDVIEGCLAARQQGFKAFQLKPGKNADRHIDEEIDQIQAAADLRAPGEIVVADANGNWTLTEAIRAAHALRDTQVIIEQPCASWEECIVFGRQCTLPVKLDELIETPQDIIRGFDQGAMDIVAIKTARVGGLTKARQMRDLALSLGISVVPDDTWGSEIVSSALLHFAASTDPRYLLCYTDLTAYNSVSTASGYPQRHGGEIQASSAPGLGLALKRDVLGPPIAVVSEPGA